MATNLNNIHINSFSKGMNTDTSLDMVGNELYVFGLNIRITANALLNGAIDSNSKEGIVTPVLSGLLNHGSFDDRKEKSTILAIATLGNIGAIIIKDPTTDTSLDAEWSIYRVDYHEDHDTLSFERIFTSDETTDKDKFSVVINKETEKLVKLYIADGKHEIMSINIADKAEDLLKLKVDDLINNRYFPESRIIISDKISGTLKTGQVLYTYRFYKKNGVCSKLAPLTNKIQVIDASRYKEIGNAENTQTTVGFLLTIHSAQDAVRAFDHVLIYRLEYTKPNSDASVSLIYDAEFDGSHDVKINDNGLLSIQDLSIQEFAALDTIDIVPTCIEQNQNYMFSANITDNTRIRIGNDIKFDAKAYQCDNQGKIYLYKNEDTIYKYESDPINNVDSIGDGYVLNKYSDMTIDRTETSISHECKYVQVGDDLYLGGAGKNVSWRFVTTDVPLDSVSKVSGLNPPKPNDDSTHLISYLKYDNGLIITEPYCTTDKYFVDHGINAKLNISYEDLFTSSLLRSLRRDEVYRYGIVLYDNHGRRSDVQWIADIRTPSEQEFPSTSFESTLTSNYTIFNYDAPYVSYVNNTNVMYTMKQELELNCNNTSQQYSITDNSSCSIEFDYDSLCSGTVTFDIPSTVVPSQTQLARHISFENIPVRNIKSYLLDRINLLYGVSCTLSDDTRILPYAYMETLYNTAVAKVSNIKFILAVQPGEFKNVAINNFSIRPKFKITISNNVQNDDSSDTLYARPLGIQFDVKNLPKGISYYLIVRCAKTASYTKNLMQCAVARPVKQWMLMNGGSNSNIVSRYSPYYPNPFLTSDYIRDAYWIHSYADNKIFTATSEDNLELFLIFSPEILFTQDDALLKLQSFVSKVCPVYFAYGELLSTTNARLSCNTVDTYYTDSDYLPVDHRYNVFARDIMAAGVYYLRPFTKGTDYDIDGTDRFGNPNDMYAQPKEDMSFIFKNYNKALIQNSTTREIQDIKNVSNPTWEQGFSNILLNGSEILTGVKQYKSFTTSINKYDYVNWVCNGMYDLRLCNNIPANYNLYGDNRSTEGLSVMIEPGKNWSREIEAKGWIGPGPRCFLMSINNSSDKYGEENMYGRYSMLLDYKSYMSHLGSAELDYLSTCIVNIQHVPSQYAGLTNEEKLYDVYYGFGNISSRGAASMIVFDGDVYITPCEITSMYKTYNFNSYDTIPSALFIYYIPMESTINTYFDYGMGYRNTKSNAVMIEPGEISGIKTQSRPEHQYNMIYSDNNVSNDIYTVQSLEDSEQTFPQRIHYSVLKTNGEMIDNWQMFKALDYIDVDTRYGLITELLTSKDTLYFWQKLAFGKLSVNERSLVTDNNSNTIQLGQGGVLQRSDYINTRYGMRDQDHSAISAEGAIYWIDIINKAILMSNGQNVINLGEQLNVQNCINKHIVEDIPTIHYDLQNNELLCKCLDDGKQIVFNVKLNIATSVYDRHYEDSIMFNNVLFGVMQKEIRKYNYIQGKPEYDKITSILKFVVNSSASTTKVFDNQEIVTLARGSKPSDYFDEKYFAFTTNIIDKTKKNPVGYTDREGNVRYTIPRYGEQEYGNRMRGKWLKVDIEDRKPKYEHSISHILTKFRQSFS